MNLLHEALPIWTDAYEAARMGDDARWELIPMCVTVPSPIGPVAQVHHVFALFVPSPLLGQPPITALVTLTDPSTIVRREAADEVVRAAFGFCRGEASKQLAGLNGGLLG